MHSKQWFNTMRLVHWYFSTIWFILVISGFDSINSSKLNFDLLLTGQSETSDLTNYSDSQNECVVYHWLYTPENVHNPMLLNSFKHVPKNRPIVFLIHGWGGNRDVFYIQDIKNAYLSKMNHSVIIVDYGECINEGYISSCYQVPYVSAQLANFICNLTSTLGVRPEKMHIVGHSLGAHVAGLAGDGLRCGKIGRITGLDPAGPYFNNVNSSLRLDKSDAIFVDVIHTNLGILGYKGYCGHVDFYPNCGFLQPECLEENIIKLKKNFWNIWKFPLDFVRCDHHRSCSLFVESIKYNNLLAKPCTSGCGLWLRLCEVDLHGETVHMGQYLTSKPKYAQYALNTCSTACDKK